MTPHDNKRKPDPALNGPLKKIATTGLKVGMFVVDIGRGWLHHPWPTRSKLITDSKDIERLLEYGITEVVIDPRRGQSPPGASEAEIPGAKVAWDLGLPGQVDSLSIQIQSVPSTLAEELPKAGKVYEKAVGITRDFLTDARLGRKIDVVKVEDLVEELIESLIRNQDAMIALLRLKTHDEYTFTHSLNVAVLCLAVGKQEGMSRRQLLNLGLGGIFHDLGKTRIPIDLLRKKGKLDAEEFGLMKTHPAIGSGLLREQAPRLSETVFEVIRHHHERIDGSGYPDGLRDNSIPTAVFICGMADVYDALSSDRVYHQALLPYESLRILFAQRGEKFPLLLTERFVQSVGIYPVGACVRLTSGEVGIVTGINRANLARPIVRLLLKPSGHALRHQRTVDLVDPGMSGIQVAEVLAAPNFGIDPLQQLSQAS